MGLDSESEWSRFFPVRTEDGQRHIPLEARGLAASTLHAFLAWVAPQYDDVLEDLRTGYNTALPKIQKNMPRIATTHFVITWVSHLFCCFCGECCGLTEKAVKQLCDQFNNAASTSVRFLMNQIRILQSKTPQKTIAQVIADGITSGDLSVCTKRKKIFESGGYEDDGKIYLWPNAALGWVTGHAGYQDCTKIRISKYLSSTGILIREYGDAQENTVHLEVGGKRWRFLCLDKEALYRVASQGM